MFQLDSNCYANFFTIIDILLISIAMKKLLLIIIFLLSLQIDVHATMYQYDLYDSISYNDLNVSSTAIIIDTSLDVSRVSTINNDGYWGWGYIASDSNVRPVPEPATMFLLGTGLIALGWVGRKKIINGNRK
jgi:hypothetical protein